MDNNYGLAQRMININHKSMVERERVIEVCISHFKDLIGLEFIINKDALKALQEFYNVVGCDMNRNICQELDVDFEEVEMEKVLLHLPNSKSPRWDDIIN